MKQEDLTCISTLCSAKGVSQCCDTIKKLTVTIKGQTPDTLHIDPDAFNRLAALTGGEVSAVNATDVAKNKPKGTKYVAKKQAAPKKVVIEEKMPDPKPWAAELGWDLDASGKFHYSPGGKKGDPDFVPEGCHEYSHVDLCFSPKQGDAWVLRKTRNMELHQLQCIGYLCNHFDNEKCCGSILAIKSTINGHNWYHLAETEDNFD